MRTPTIGRMLVSSSSMTATGELDVSLGPILSLLIVPETIAERWTVQKNLMNFDFMSSFNRETQHDMVSLTTMRRHDQIFSKAKTLSPRKLQKSKRNQKNHFSQMQNTQWETWKQSLTESFVCSCFTLGGNPMLRNLWRTPLSCRVKKHMKRVHNFQLCRRCSTKCGILKRRMNHLEERANFEV